MYRCCDTALRDGLQLDLQQLVHEDMTQNFSQYPPNWDLKRPDKNIDHRRVPNLQTYFKRQGYQLPKSTDSADYQAGDIVTCTVGGRLPHIMIVSEKHSTSLTPFVIHNIGSGTQEEDILFNYPITGHYRISHINTDTNRNPPPPNFTEYIVGSKNDGGTLSGISKLFYGTPIHWNRIYQANRPILSTPDIIRNGMKLRIPRTNKIQQTKH
tara:strand:+ start:749 stop:1381 length:633 start_codon:yes stop_codon:yes gene_type:complete